MYKTNIHLICRFCYSLTAYKERASALFPCSGVLAVAFLSFLLLEDTFPHRVNWDPAC